MSAASHAHQHPATTNGGNAHQKSFKRKYRKLRYKFKDVMKQSDELFRQEQLSTSALRRMQEENTRLLDLLVDLNEIGHMPKELRHNIGSPSRATPPRFLSPTMLATITGGDPSLLEDADDDVEEMDLDASGGAATLTAMQSGASAAAAGGEENTKSTSSSDDDDDDDSDSDSDSGDDTSKPAVAGEESNFNSDDEDDKEAYLEEIREWKYQRGEPGTPPRKIRDKMRAEAEQERKDAQEQAKKAAAEQAEAAAAAAAAATAEEEEGAATLPVNGAGEADAANGTATSKEEIRKSLTVETYRRGHTPDYLKDSRPFLMTLEEEEEWYNDIHNRYDGHIPPSLYPTSPSLKADGDPRNPMSVYCWLRKNQPQVFLQGEEGGEKKPGGRGRGGGRKKVVDAAADSDDGASASVKVAASKRRRTNGDEAGDSPSATRGRGGGSGGGRGGLSLRGGRRKADGEPPVKKQRR